MKRPVFAIVGMLLLAVPAHAAPDGAQAPGGKAVSFPASDGVGVAGTWYAPADSGPVMVIAPPGHGAPEALLSAVQAWHDRGYGVLTFRYRGFRPDGSRPDSIAQVVFASAWVNDMLGALHYGRAHATGNRHVFAWGQDIGGPVAVAAAARERHACDGLATEGLFRTAQEQLAALGLGGFPNLVQLHRQIVDDTDDPISAANRLQVPLFVVLAARDSLTPPAITQQVAARNLVRWNGWTLPDAGHAGAERSPGYFDKLAAWFRQWLAFPVD